MATFSIRFLGCKVSYTDAREIHEQLLADGHEERPAAAEVAVVNTCCVTNEAVRKSRQAVRRAARSHERVYVTGCAANLAQNAFEDIGQNVMVVARRSEATPALVARDIGRIGCRRDDAHADRVRAFVKVQDGCSFSCSFCVVPLVRGASRSRKAEAVLAEIRRRVADGRREIVLTGINLGCYRDRQARYGLPELLRQAGSVPGLARLRLSSIEVNHLNEALLSAMRETPTVSPHLHVPLQSGDDRVLLAMKRRYRASAFLRRLERAEGFNVTTDVIVGFPGEDERAFENTLATVKAAGITACHVFPYSPRPGTETSGEDTVPAQVKKERSARVRAASRVASLAHWRSKLGGEDEVLIDRPGRGYGDDYSPWLVEGEVGALVRVRAGSVVEEGILAA